VRTEKGVVGGSESTTPAKALFNCAVTLSRSFSLAHVVRIDLLSMYTEKNKLGISVIKSIKTVLKVG